jgi:hypothetical protein
VRAGHPDEVADYLYRQADALYREGDERGDDDALKQSIDTWHLVLQHRMALDWARTQNNLGVVLRVVGERENGTERQTETVAAYRAAQE